MRVSAAHHEPVGVGVGVGVGLGGVGVGEGGVGVGVGTIVPGVHNLSSMTC